MPFEKIYVAFIASTLIVQIEFVSHCPCERIGNLLNKNQVNDSIPRYNSDELFSEFLHSTPKQSKPFKTRRKFTPHGLPFSLEEFTTKSELGDFNFEVSGEQGSGNDRRRRDDNDDDGTKKGKKGEDHSGETDGDSNHSTTDLYIQGDLDAKEIDYEEGAEEAEIIRNMMFNNPIREAWTTTYINHSVVEEKCEQSNPCLASERVSPVCGSDWGSYLNPGVFRCAQKCEKGLTVFNMGPCPGYVMPPMPPATTVPPPTTPEPEHETPDSRLRIRGIFVQPLFRLLGLHVHEDGGFYLSNEKKNHTWWNI